MRRLGSGTAGAAGGAGATLGVWVLVATAWGAVALAPEVWRAAPGAEVAVRAQQRAVDGYGAAPWPGERIAWMFVRGGGEHRNLHQPEATDGDARVVTIARAGATMIGVELAERIERVAPEDLADLLAREGVVPPAEAQEAARGLLAGADGRAGEVVGVRVRIVECAQAIVRAADGREQTPSPVALAKGGLAAEIRLMMDPTALVAPTDVMVRLYAGHASREGLRVRARNLTTGTTSEAVSGEGGIATISLADRGVWRLEFAVAERADGVEADVVVWSSSLGFEGPNGK